MAKRFDERLHIAALPRFQEPLSFGSRDGMVASQARSIQDGDLRQRSGMAPER